MSNLDNTTALAENKVLILYILNKISNGILEDGLYKIISSINDINYFYFKEVLTDLLNSKLVGIFTKEEEESVLRITTDGKNSLSLTLDILPGILKLKADNVFEEEFSSITDETSIIAEFIPRNAIDDYMKNPENYDYTKYLKEIEKSKTREFTTFYFNDKNNKDIQDMSGRQYNDEYEFGGKIIEYNEEKSTIEIKNKLNVGDEMEIIIPNRLEPEVFEIEKLWDYETNEEISSVSPGVKGQKVFMKLPIKCEEGWILRRKK